MRFASTNSRKSTNFFEIFVTAPFEQRQSWHRSKHRPWGFARPHGPRHDHRSALICQRSADAFVTRFTGIAGEFAVLGWERVRDGVATARLPFAPEVSVEATMPASELSGPVALLVRAAGVSFVAEGQSGAVPGVVRDTAFTGRGYEHVIAVGEKASLTKVFATHRVKRGSRVHVAFAPAACFVFSTNDGSN